eukprot:TRINITY_DN4321_c1_g1_i3.p1 TRINITY_DN4321_c1_g1~~TRINITY_DN4321_c1_g1_i3.p1  ORF type:complete len:546 (+),score=46.63 TRINITY_DN4321_c1_g1_i3:184-1638(+)
MYWCAIYPVDVIKSAMMTDVLPRDQRQIICTKKLSAFCLVLYRFNKFVRRFSKVQSYNQMLITQSQVMLQAFLNIQRINIPKYLNLYQSTNPIRNYCQQQTKKFELKVLRRDLLKSKVPLDLYLSKSLPTETKSKLKACIKLGHVAVNGVCCTGIHKWLQSGDIVSITIPPELKQFSVSPLQADLDIVFEDEDLIVLNKAAGMSIHGGFANTEPTVIGALLHYMQVEASEQIKQGYQVGTDEDVEEVKEETIEVKDRIYPRIVHRLDRGTTGLMVIAKKHQIAKHLIQQFKQHKIRRSYLSILVGCPKRDEGKITTRIGSHPQISDKMTTYPLNRKEGREALSQFYLLESLADNQASLVEWQLGSGKKHQIRVHAAYMGFPVLGDEKYGDNWKSVKKMSKGRKKRKEVVLEVLRLLRAPALHSQTLQFEHPIRQEKMSFRQEAPEIFQMVIEKLRVIDYLNKMNKQQQTTHENQNDQSDAFVPT